MSDYKDNPSSRKISELTNLEAKDYLMKCNHYFNLPLPKYFTFKELLETIEQEIDKTGLEWYSYPALVDIKKSGDKAINYPFTISKNAIGDSRNIELINPILYILMVKTLTDEKNWKVVQALLNYSSTKTDIPERIVCLSTPKKSDSRHSDPAEQVSFWWREVEQKSIRNAMKYDYIKCLDIANCYPSIHLAAFEDAIKWGREQTLAEGIIDPSTEKLGVTIVSILAAMNGQKKFGIPQGSSLMDLLAELVFAFSDQQVNNSLNTLQIENFNIQRYRDDYRIFSIEKNYLNDISEVIMKVNEKLGFSLNTSKTEQSEKIVKTSIKPGKHAKLNIKSYTGDLIKRDPKNNGLLVFQCDNPLNYRYRIYKDLLQFYNFSVDFPNDGQLKRMLGDLVKVIDISYRNSKLKAQLSASDSLPYSNEIVGLQDGKVIHQKDFFQTLIAILSEMLVYNPGVCVQICALLSNFLEPVKDIQPQNENDSLTVYNGKLNVLKEFEDKIQRKIEHTSLISIWLQRVYIGIYKGEYESLMPKEDSLLNAASKTASKDSTLNAIWPFDILNSSFEDAILDSTIPITSLKKRLKDLESIGNMPLNKLINQKELDSIESRVEYKEIELFTEYNDAY